jgi:hypothetical protein
VSQRTIEVSLPQLRPGTYMILCATFAAGQLGPFELCVFADTTNGVGVDQVYPPVWRTGASTQLPGAGEKKKSGGDDDDDDLGGDEEAGGGGGDRADFEIN